MPARISSRVLPLMMCAAAEAGLNTGSLTMVDAAASGLSDQIEETNG